MHSPSPVAQEVVAGRVPALTINGRRRELREVLARWTCHACSLAFLTGSVWLPGPPSLEKINWSTIGTRDGENKNEAHITGHREARTLTRNGDRKE